MQIFRAEFQRSVYNRVLIQRIVEVKVSTLGTLIVKWSVQDNGPTVGTGRNQGACTAPRAGRSCRQPRTLLYIIFFWSREQRRWSACCFYNLLSLQISVVRIIGHVYYGHEGAARALDVFWRVRVARKDSIAKRTVRRPSCLIIYSCSSLWKVVDVRRNCSSSVVPCAR